MNRHADLHAFKIDSSNMRAVRRWRGDQTLLPNHSLTTRCWVQRPDRSNRTHWCMICCMLCSHSFSITGTYFSFRLNVRRMPQQQSVGRLVRWWRICCFPRFACGFISLPHAKTRWCFLLCDTDTDRPCWEKIRFFVLHGVFHGAKFHLSSFSHWLRSLLQLSTLYMANVYICKLLPFMDKRKLIINHHLRVSYNFSRLIL